MKGNRGTNRKLHWIEMFTGLVTSLQRQHRPLETSHTTEKLQIHFLDQESLQKRAVLMAGLFTGAHPSVDSIAMRV